MASFLIAVDNTEVSGVKTVTLGGGWGYGLIGDSFPHSLEL